ncbi:6638_t:CDS:2 [Diversispora eburnea]|uniref:6638_t:CDS:1 n=1 Tax=Diversispora eburnea TaxID=1213867 RepID=A0A9N8VJQ4_9GLOM|nr:6638_t:CDS:2 [Diversispora eburnea]
MISITEENSEIAASTRSYLPSFMERSSRIQPSLRPPILDATSNDKAERYSIQNPPQEKLPPPNSVILIQGLGGAKAWEWEPVEDLLAQQDVSIEKETNIVTFHKRKIATVQTNYPFFIPQAEGDKLYEAPFETPTTMPHRQGQMLHYFEITVLENPEGQNTLPGWNIHSVSYQSADGLKYNDSIKGEKFSEPWGEGDTIGCGYNPDIGQVFFTKNGTFRIAFTGINHIWYPTIGSTGPCTLKANFGDDFDNEYLYDSAKGYGPGGPLLRSSIRRSRPVRRSTSDSNK